MLVSQMTEIRHNINILDFEQMGLNPEEEFAIAEITLFTQNQLADRLNELKRLRGDAEQIVNINQKIINDTTKTINALEVTLDSDQSTAGTEVSIIEQLIKKLKIRRDLVFLIRNQAVSDANMYAQEATIILDRLRTIGTLVK